MEAIYPISALYRDSKQIRNAAKHDIVRITENGSGAYIFCTEDVFEERLKTAAEEAAYAERMAGVIRQSRDDFATGRYYEGTDAVLEAIEKQAIRG